MTVITRQAMSVKLDRLLALLEQGRTICEEQRRNDEAWRMADLSVRLREKTGSLQEPPLPETATRWMQLAARVDFANERLAAAITEFAGGLDCAKNSAKIIGYVDDIMRTMARLGL